MTLTWLDWLLMLVHFTFVMGVGFALQKKDDERGVRERAAAGAGAPRIGPRERPVRSTAACVPGVEA
jgi:hypothetical protein